MLDYGDHMLHNGCDCVAYVEDKSLKWAQILGFLGT